MPDKSNLENRLIPFDDIRPDLREDANRLINSALKSFKPSPKPRLIHLCGIPGAGKTSYTNHFLTENNEFALVQFDSVMESLPGYSRDLKNLGSVEAFGKWELPARMIGYHLLQVLVDAGYDIFFDHSALNRAHVDLIKAVQSRGYTTEMHYVECSLDEALLRVQRRQQLLNRHTPEYVVRERHELLQELLPVYRTLVNSFVHVEPLAYSACLQP